MAELLLFHHAQGQTEGFKAFADELRSAGHTVHTPDLFDGRTFSSIDEGVAYASEIGFGELIERGVREADELPNEVVYGGFSLGVLPAQKLAQTRPGASGALLFYSCVPMSEHRRGRPTCPCRSTGWTRIRTSSGRVTSTPRARLSTRRSKASCSSIQATSTTSRTRACPPTTPKQPRC